MSSEYVSGIWCLARLQIMKLIAVLSPIHDLAQVPEKISRRKPPVNPLNLGTPQKPIVVNLIQENRVSIKASN